VFGLSTTHVIYVYMIHVLIVLWTVLAVFFPHSLFGSQFDDFESSGTLIFSLFLLLPIFARVFLMLRMNRNDVKLFRSTMEDSPSRERWIVSTSLLLMLLNSLNSTIPQGEALSEWVGNTWVIVPYFFVHKLVDGQVFVLIGWYVIDILGIWDSLCTLRENIENESVDLVASVQLHYDAMERIRFFSHVWSLFLVPCFLLSGILYAFILPFFAGDLFALLGLSLFLGGTLSLFLLPAAIVTRESYRFKSLARRVRAGIILTNIEMNQRHNWLEYIDKSMEGFRMGGVELSGTAMGRFVYAIVLIATFLGAL